MGGIDGAAANGIVRVIADEQFPCLVHDRTGVGDATGFLMYSGWSEGSFTAGLQFSPGRKRLHPAFEQVLRVVIALLDPHPGGKDSRQNVSLVGVAQLTLQGLERDVSFRNFIGDGCQVAWKSRVDCLPV